MSRPGTALSRVTLVGLSATVAGCVVLFVQAASEVLSDPSLTLIDGYWIGRLPWTAVGVDLLIVGATITVVVGTATVWLVGGAMGRAGSAIALAVAAFWWFLAVLPPPQAVPCQNCPPPGPDPVTMAYSQPVSVALLLVLPAVVVGVIALVRSGGRAAAVQATAG